MRNTSPTSAALAAGAAAGQRRVAAGCLLGVAAVLLTVVGCTPAWRGKDTATVSAEDETIRAVVEKLAVNVHELRFVYDELHIVARDALVGENPDRQLDYIQKVYLQVDAAQLVAEYQYRMLSVIHYIKDARRTDYLTLRARGLDKARTRLGTAIEHIALYDAFIKNPKATATIAQARALIQGNIYLYDQLLEILRPLVHPAGAFTPDPYSPI